MDSGWTPDNNSPEAKRLADELNRGLVTPGLTNGPRTPGLDSGPRTPGLDNGPRTPELDDQMHGFIKDTLKAKDANKNAERSAPRVYQPVTSTFTSAPIQTLKSEPPLGRKTTVKVVEGSTSMAASGAFYTMRTVVSGVDAGDIYLQGGVVSGGTGNKIVDEIFLYDLSTDTWQGAPGEHIQLTVTGDGQETSGILDPAFNVLSVAVSNVTTMGTNTLPSSGDVTGKLCRISLGSYFDGGFTPAGAGNLGVGFCWNGYTISRF